MKKLIVPLAALAVLFACNSGGSKEEEKKEEPKKEEAAKEDITKNPDYEKGIALIAKSDCLTCHKVDEVITGPSYRDIANKYAGNTSDTVIPYLAGKIISGGYGVWGAASMTAHAGLSKEDAEAMAKYVLLLKNK